MARREAQGETPAVVQRDDLQRLFEALSGRGYRLLGPAIRDRAIVYDDVSSVDDLPVGWGDEQDKGTYRLKKREDKAVFNYVVGPESWKKFLFEPARRLWQARRNGEEGFQIVPERIEAPKMAFIGVRSCEIHALAVQDKVFAEGQYADPAYQARRCNVFIVAANCVCPAGTCFCASMNTGPKATAGFDLALTEILSNGRHYFVAETGTQAGEEVLGKIPHQKAGSEEIDAADEAMARAGERMGRMLDTGGIKEMLYRNEEHPRWDDVAGRCLNCCNCTMVCPTCFCSTVEDTTDLTGECAERWRRWDSCYSLDFSYIHGGSVRTSAKSRYRQWMTHKIATWIDQFGVSGCVGCGRCITWCPVGIDITEEARAIRETERAGAEASKKERRR